MEEVDARVRDAVLGGEGDEEAVGEVVGEGEEVAHVPVGAEAAERLAGVLHQEMSGQQAAQDADVGLEDLESVRNSNLKTHSTETEVYLPSGTAGATRSDIEVLFISF